ncbi:MAG: tetratricopeptide repeat protein [bacterium]|nr:tetratricopeptide repeat protein [bacterium]
MNKTAATYNKAGKQYYKVGKFTEAVDAFMTGVAYDPKNASLHYNLAAALCKNGEYGSSALEAEKALAIDPDYEKARDLLDTLKAMWLIDK